MKIRDEYNFEEAHEEIGNFFEKEGYVQLSNFFTDKEKVEKARTMLKKKKFNRNYSPLTNNVEEADIKEIFEPEVLEIVEFFRSNEFSEFLENTLSLDLDLVDISIKKYSHKDYIIINDLSETKDDYVNIIYDLTEDWKSNFGGILTYTTEEEEIFYLKPSMNTLSIVFKPKEIYKYLKYINNLSERKSIIRIEINYKIN